jgi:hypothetical protein
MLAIGCGDDDAATGSSTTDSNTTSSSVTTSDVTPTTADATSSDSADSESSNGTSTSSSNGTTDATTGVETTTTADESSSSTTASGEVTVRAFAVPGGLDRIWITAADSAASLCVAGILVWPDGGMGGVELPDQWGFQDGWVSDTPADCEQIGSPPDAVASISATGSVQWEGSPLPYPCEIDVDVELDFPGGAPWVPDTAAIVAQGVAVEGC